MRKLTVFKNLFNILFYYKKEISRKKDNKGQTLVEFILLLGVIVMLSYTLMSGLNGGVADRWRILVMIITSPNIESLDTSIELR